jgi:hypothetical protein
MIWHYNCPNCGQELDIDWDYHNKELTCPACSTTHHPPTPLEDHYAWFGGDHWPHEIEKEVISLRGTTCDVPGCYNEHNLLVTRKPTILGGRVSIDNLIPMCAYHARLKGEQDYETWVRDLSPEERAGGAATVEMTFTDKRPEPEQPSQPDLPGSSSGAAVPLCGQALLDTGPPPGMHRVCAMPFPPGSFRQLAFSYRCLFRQDGTCRVLLAAWPDTVSPDWSEGIEHPDVLLTVRQYEGTRDTSIAARLELNLPVIDKDTWIAAAFIEDSDAHPLVQDYLLYGIR